MKTLYFEISIHTPIHQVYKKMLGKGTFEQWTSEFSPTSRYEGNWGKGSNMLFLSDEANGKVCGMISKVKDNQQDKFVSLEHIGLYEGGRELMEGEKVDPFSGALEEYTFSETVNGTFLKIRMDVVPEWEQYFMEAWPRALKHLKNICED